jgi:hypothetical protein
VIVDPALEQFARTLMARALDDRFASASAALAALSSITRLPAPPRTPRATDRRPREAMAPLRSRKA